ALAPRRLRPTLNSAKLGNGRYREQAVWRYHASLIDPCRVAPINHAIFHKISALDYPPAKLHCLSLPLAIGQGHRLRFVSRSTLRRKARAHCGGDHCSRYENVSHRTLLRLTLRPSSNSTAYRRRSSLQEGRPVKRTRYAGAFLSAWNPLSA